MSKIYIYSTLAADTRYAVYADTASDLPVVTRTVLVKGGAGVANKNFVTPRGVMTEVTGEELEMLKANKVFQKHVQGGYISHDEKKADVEKVVSNMTGRDSSAPIVPQDYDPEQAGAKPSDVSVEEKPRGRRG